MRAGTKKSLIAGLDIGTAKVVALVGETSDSGEVQLLGIGSDLSRGLKRGVVVDIENTVKSIRHAVEEAEVMAGQPIRSVYVGVAGGHIRSLNSQGIVAIRDGEVSNGDVDRVIDAARAVPIRRPEGPAHPPQEFIVDDQDGIREPVGMSGVRLESQVHIVTGAASASQNIVKCVHRCGLDVEDIVLEQLASSQAVLMEDEKDLGVCLVDIGGGTTDIALFGGGAIRHTAVIPIAGAQVTNDIALALRTPIPHAEEIKIQYGCARAACTSEDETIQVPAARRSSVPAPAAQGPRGGGGAALRRAARPRAGPHPPRRAGRSGRRRRPHRRERAHGRAGRDGRGRCSRCRCASVIPIR